MFSPCRDYCYVRLGKQYSEECDNTCEYAKTIKELKMSLKNANDMVNKYEKYFTHLNESIDNTEKLISKTEEVITGIKNDTAERARLQMELLEKINR